MTGRICLAVLLSLLGAQAAKATPINYSFTVASAFFGGTMNGSFTFDAVTNLESNVSISVAGVTAPFAGLNGLYTQVAPQALSLITPTGRFSAGSDVIIGTSATGGSAWIAFAPGALGPQGGGFTTAAVFDAQGGSIGSANDVIGAAVAASVATPEPASLMLLGFASIPTLLLRRRAASPSGAPAPRR